MVIDSQLPEYESGSNNLTRIFASVDEGKGITIATKIGSQSEMTEGIKYVIASYVSRRVLLIKPV